jgi:hypothetical protein
MMLAMLGSFSRSLAPFRREGKAFLALDPSSQVGWVVADQSPNWDEWNLAQFLELPECPLGDAKALSGIGRAD